MRGETVPSDLLFYLCGHTGMCMGGSVSHVRFSHSPTLFFEIQSLTEPGVLIQLGCFLPKSPKSPPVSAF